MKKQNQPQKGYESIENSELVDNNKDFSCYLGANNNELSPIKQLHLNNEIYRKVQQTYFPQQTINLEMFQQMLFKERKLEQQK
jgi:hypothetical protein